MKRIKKNTTRQQAKIRHLTEMVKKKTPARKLLFFHNLIDFDFSRYSSIQANFWMCLNVKKMFWTKRQRHEHMFDCLPLFSSSKSQKFDTDSNFLLHILTFNCVGKGPEIKRVSIEVKRVSTEIKRVSTEIKRVSIEIKVDVVWRENRTAMLDRQMKAKTGKRKSQFFFYRILCSVRTHVSCFGNVWREKDKILLLWLYRLFRLHRIKQCARIVSVYRAANPVPSRAQSINQSMVSNHVLVPTGQV